MIAIPSNRDWNPSFTLSLFDLGFHINRIGIEAFVRPFFSSCLSESRQNLLDLAIEKKFTHILFIDDDMRFNTQAFDILRSRNKDFVAPTIALRNIEPIRTNTVDESGSNLTSAGKNGIERINMTGLAFALINVDAIKNIPKPHFEVRWSEDKHGYIHEDEFFCNLLKQHGVELYADHDAARHVWHIGTTGQQEKFS